MKKAVIFDMDGLMIDSERVTFEEYEKKLKQLGYQDFNESLYLQCLGKNKKGICQVFYDHYGNDFPMEEVWDEVHISIDERLREFVPKKPGLNELLQYLNQQGYKVVIATSSSRNRVDEIIRCANIEAYIDDSICGDEVSHGKPDPEIFLKACEKVSVDPLDALVLEDSEPGILAAYRGGIDVICIPDMKFPSQKFEAMTTAIKTSLLDIIPILNDKNP